MQVPNYIHNSGKEQKRTLKPQALRSAKKRAKHTRLRLTVSKPPEKDRQYTLIRLAMNTYQVIYRLKNDDVYRSHHFIKADCDEDAAYEALDFAKSHKYSLLDVKKVHIL